VTRNPAASPANIEDLGAKCVENPRVSGSIPLQATIFKGFAAENVLQKSNSTVFVLFAFGTFFNFFGF
jgi:hypothetical protein